jgi:excisionase family DNA binding protein
MAANENQRTPVEGILGREWDGHYSFSIAETAKLLNISVAKTYLMTQAGELPVIAIGRAKRVARRTIERMLAG